MIPNIVTMKKILLGSLYLSMSEASGRINMYPNIRVRKKTIAGIEDIQTDFFVIFNSFSL